METGWIRECGPRKMVQRQGHKHRSHREIAGFGEALSAEPIDCSRGGPEKSRDDQILPLTLEGARKDGVVRSAVGASTETGRGFGEDNGKALRGDSYQRSTVEDPTPRAVLEGWPHSVRAVDGISRQAPAASPLRWNRNRWTWPTRRLHSLTFCTYPESTPRSELVVR